MFDKIDIFLVEQLFVHGGRNRVVSGPWIVVESSIDGQFPDQHSFELHVVRD